MDEIYVGYTPNKGYSWNDDTNKMIQVEYVVHGLPTGVTKPTTTNAPIKFTGINGHGTYKTPTYKNTTVQLFDFQNHKIDKPLTNLSNYPYYTDSMYVGYTPNKGYAWSDNTRSMIEVNYVVHGLIENNLVKPTTSNAPIKFTGAKYSGTFSIKYKNTTVQYFDLNNKRINNPPINLSNGDKIQVGYTPNKGYAWEDCT